MDLITMPSRKLTSITTVLAAALSSIGCFQDCYTPYAGYDVIGRIVDAESGASLANASLEIRLENDDGPIGETATALADENGAFRHNPLGEFGQMIPGIRSSIVVTDSASERCYHFTLGDFAAASQGLLGPEAFPALTSPSGLEPPPQPTRALLTVEVTGSTAQIVVDVSEEMIVTQIHDDVNELYCSALSSGPANNVLCLVLGVVPVSPN